MDKVAINLKDELQQPTNIDDVLSQVGDLREMFKELKASNKGRCYREADDIGENRRSSRSFSASRVKNIDQLGKKV